MKFKEAWEREREIHSPMTTNQLVSTVKLLNQDLFEEFKEKFKIRKFKMKSIDRESWNQQAHFEMDEQKPDWLKRSNII